MGPRSHAWYWPKVQYRVLTMHSRVMAETLSGERFDMLPIRVRLSILFLLAALVPVAAVVTTATLARRVALP